MFLQVIQGRVGSPHDAARQGRRWLEEVAPTAIGWLGETSGITDDGEWLMLARFTSAADAASNSDLPLQDSWWNETEKVFIEPPTFVDCSNPVLFKGGGSNRAGFVQVITGRVADPETWRQMPETTMEALAAHRPEILGTSLAIADDGRMAEFVYFTSEEDARAGESKERPPEVAALMDQLAQVEDLRFFDLRDPQLFSPADSIPMPELHRRAIAWFDHNLHAVADDQWGLPTPCADWDVRGLVNHLVYENLWTPPLLEGRTIAEVGDRYDGDVLGDDPLGAWASASAGAVDAVTRPGAMEATAHLSFGDTPGHDYAAQLFMDHLIHGWDLATAIGADPQMDPVLIEAASALFDPLEDGYRAAGAVDSAVQTPVDADAQTILLARFGRSA